MKRVLEQIHDRSLWQVLGVYLASSWVVLQVIDTLESVIGLPEWVPSVSVWLLVIGLPIVMATAFVQKGFGRSASPADDPPGIEAAGTPGGQASVRDSAGAARRWLTWRNALAGGVGAFALLGIGTAAWLGMRAAGIGPAGTLVAKGVLTERDVILLADFESSSGDPTLADVVTEALRVDLSQSEAVRLADAGFVASALGRMERTPDTPISEAVAREIGQREGIKAYVGGEAARVGSGFALTARVVRPGDGEILVSGRESARDSTELIDAIDRLSRRIRERIGDPLTSLAADPPLAQVTTSDLEALRLFTTATRLPDAEIERILRLLEEAVAVDSTFAMAWRAIGISLQNYGYEPGRAMDALSRAYELRERLPGVERDRISAMYYMNVTSEPLRAIPMFEAAIERDPANPAPLTNIGEAYRELGELETALRWYDSALTADSMQSIALMNVAQVRVTLGDFEAAREAAELLDRRGHAPFGSWHRAMVFATGRQWLGAEREMVATRDAVGGSPFLMTATTQWLGSIIGTQGRLEEGGGLWRSAEGLHAERGATVEAVRTAIPAAVIGPLVRRQPDRSGLDDILSRYRLDDLPPLERPYLDLAEAYGVLGYPDDARRFLERLGASVPSHFLRGVRHQRHLTLGHIARAEGRPLDAVAEYRLASSRPQEIEPFVHMARAFEAAGETDSARVYYRRFVDTPHWLRVIRDPIYLGPALETLARLEYEAGDLQAAARYYSEFVELWARADDDLQPRVRAAQARLQEIYDAIG